MKEKWEESTFKDIAIGQHFKYDEEDYKSNWIKVSRDEAICFNFTRQFHSDAKVYYEFNKYLKELTEWEQSPEGVTTIQRAIEECKEWQERNKP